MVRERTATFIFSGIGGGETVSGSGRMRFAPGTYDADVELTMPETGRVRAVLMPSVCYLALPEAKGLPTNAELGNSLPEPHPSWMTHITEEWERRVGR